MAKQAARFWCLILLLCIQLALSLPYLDRVPRVFVDEAWDSALAWNIARNGQIAHPFIEGFGGMNIHFIQNRMVMPFVSALVFQFTDCTVFTGRLGSVLFSVLAVCSLFVLTSRWFGNKQAFWICLATIFNPWFFDVTRRARPEIHYAALGIVLLLLVASYFESGSRLTAFLCGITGGLLALTHPNGIIIMFCIGVSALVWLRSRPVLPLFTWGFPGLFIVLLPYLIYVLYAVRNPEVSFLAQMQGGLAEGSFFYKELVRYKHFLNFPYMLPIGILMFISFVAAWFDSRKEEKVLAGITVLYFLMIPFLSVHTTARYLAAVVPFMSILIVRLIWRTARWGQKQKRLIGANYALVIFIVLIYAVTSIWQIGSVMYSLRNTKLETVIDEISKAIEPGAKVYADPIFWFGRDKINYGPYYISYKAVLLKDYDKWACSEGFRYFVRTSWYLAPPPWAEKAPQKMPDFRENVSIDLVCKQFGIKVDTIHDPYYGTIEIYKIDWSKPYY